MATAAVLNLSAATAKRLEIGSRGFAFRSWREYGNHGTTAVIRFADGTAEVAGRVESGRVFIDGKGIGDVGEVVLKDRKHLSVDGMVVVIIAINQANCIGCEACVLACKESNGLPVETGPAR